ncbi:MAG: hypothetical protein AAF108_03640 [Planctomycetota bacterium]
MTPEEVVLVIRWSVAACLLALGYFIHIIHIAQIVYFWTTRKSTGSGIMIVPGLCLVLGVVVMPWQHLEMKLLAIAWIVAFDPYFVLLLILLVFLNWLEEIHPEWKQGRLHRFLYGPPIGSLDAASRPETDA